MSLEFLCNIRLLLPSSSDSFPLSEERDSTLTIEVADTHETALATSERKHRERNRDWQIDTDLTTFDVMLEFPGTVTISGEDRTPISIRVLVNEVNGVL